jgi:hypothetical protein
MPETPPRILRDDEYSACPHCTIQIHASVTLCPHCQQTVSPPDQQRSRPLPAGRLPLLWERYGRVVRLAGPVLLAVLVLAVAYNRWVGQQVKVVPNSLLPIQVEKEKKGDALILRGTVTNRGEDVPDLSLRSVAVIVEFVYRDGRRENKTVFPKAEFRGEGALLHGETGTFEMARPAKEIREIVLRSEIVDLGMGRRLIRPGGR